MSKPRGAEAAERLNPLQIVTLVLSIYVLLALLLQSLVPLSSETIALLDRVDFLVCLVFLGDFLLRLYRAPSKWQFLKWGWIDLVSSIPMFDALRVGRLVRIVRIFRTLRAFRSTRHLVAYLLRNRKGSSLTAVASISLVLVVFASAAILQFETEPESNIKSAQDAFWWSLVTITTVGYGDRFPVTSEGRIIGCILMTAGVGLFGVFTGLIASVFLRPEFEEEETETKEILSELAAINARLARLEAKLNGGEHPSDE